MIKIPLTRNLESLIDDDDFELVSKYKWWANESTRGIFYAMAHYYIDGSIRKSIKMHRLIMGMDNNLMVDHINGDTLDNQKHNLRFCTNQQNQHNQHKIRGKSLYKGVSWNTRDRRWKSCIRVGGKRIYLGYFKDEIEAAKVYDEAAIKYFGEFAHLNFL